MTRRDQSHSDRAPGRLPGSVERRVRDATDSLPGERDALPPGTLTQRPAEPQGDENREPAMRPTPPR